MLTHVHQIGVNGTPQLLYKNTYNELGQLQSKQVGGSDTSTFIGLQNVNYAYNIRGWLTAINDVQNLTQANAPQDLFALKIQYNSIENAQNNITPLYNGNIAEISWRTNSDNIRRRYGFIYDHLNRLKTAIYQRPNNAVPITNAYNESLTYDKVGNIMTLHRNGNFDHPTNIVQIDQLIYSYDSAKLNQLMKVVDQTNNPGGFTDSATNTADDYSYDSQGNMLTDANKGITQTVYNHLNLPTKIVFGTIGTIEYLYTAMGSKVQKKVTVGSTVTVTDYLGGFQYTKVGTGATVLDFFPHAEGYVKNTVTNGTNAYNYVFHYTDHLGNIRVSYGLNENGVLTILEENNYYPFGLKHKNYNVSSRQYNGNNQLPLCTHCSYEYKYNGKEWQDELGLNLYDYGARNYDASLGRWMNIDPLAEMTTSYSPYVYTLNNPVYFIDPDGMKIIDFFGIYRDYKNELNDSKKGLQILLDSGNIDKDVFEVLLNVIDNTLKELDILEDSKQVYSIVSDQRIDDGLYYESIEKDIVFVNIKKYEFGLVGHEIKHAFQYERGKISIMVHSKDIGSLYDITDETEAYNTERAIQPGPDGKLNSKFTDNDVIDFGYLNNIPYNLLPKTERNINSEFGKELRKKTIRAGAEKTQVFEVYMGWKEDYKKGLKKSRS